MRQDLNLPPFYEGQEVICLKTHSCGIVVKDNKYVVKKCFKKCCIWLVHIVGTPINELYNRGVKKSRCPLCKSVSETEKDWNLGWSLFAPIQQTKFPLMTFSEIRIREKEEQLCNN